MLVGLCYEQPPVVLMVVGVVLPVRTYFPYSVNTYSMLTEIINFAIAKDPLCPRPFLAGFAIENVEGQAATKMQLRSANRYCNFS